MDGRDGTRYQVTDEALSLLRRIVTVALTINVFLLGCELFTEFYADSHHMVSTVYLYLGLHGHNALVPWIWSWTNIEHRRQKKSKTS